MLRECQLSHHISINLPFELIALMARHEPLPSLHPIYCHRVLRFRKRNFLSAYHLVHHKFLGLFNNCTVNFIGIMRNEFYPICNTMLMLALASSFLVLFKEWESWQAYLAVGSIAIGIILALLALLLLLSNDDRKVVWRSFVETFMPYVILNQAGINPLFRKILLRCELSALWSHFLVHH